VIVHLLRHGETAHNRDGLGLGRRDEPLTETGRRQVEAAVHSLAGLALKGVYASPLARARIPAEALAARLDVPLSVNAALTEMDVGETENLPFAEMRRRFPDFLERWRGEGAFTVRMPGGESLEDVWQRLDAVVSTIERAGHDEIAVVSHNFVIRLLMCRWLGLPPARFRSFHVDLASITTLALGAPVPRIIRLNDTCHLQLLESSVNQP
jgi:broad specificity phosphatase PhoE